MGSISSSIDRPTSKKGWCGYKPNSWLEVVIFSLYSFADRGLSIAPTRRAAISISPHSFSNRFFFPCLAYSLKNVVVVLSLMPFDPATDQKRGTAPLVSHMHTRRYTPIHPSPRLIPTIGAGASTGGRQRRAQSRCRPPRAPARSRRRPRRWPPRGARRRGSGRRGAGRRRETRRGGPGRRGSRRARRRRCLFFFGGGYGGGHVGAGELKPTPEQTVGRNRSSTFQIDWTQPATAAMHATHRRSSWWRRRATSAHPSAGPRCRPSRRPPPSACVFFVGGV